MCLLVYPGSFCKKVSIFWSKPLFAETGNWSGCGVCCLAEILYNSVKMMVNRIHGWDVSLAQARELQLNLAAKIMTEGSGNFSPHLVAGVDVSSPDSRGMARGAVVVLDCPGLDIVEVKIAEAIPAIPYVSGLLSFRECPVILAACEELENIPDLVLVDGHGIAHPRRLGLASHLGLFLDVPTIGCAKSILRGRHGVVGDEPDSHAELVDKGEVIGAALRTKAGTKPVYVSIGHRVSLTIALHWVMQCCRGYRLPEPTRLAHLAAGGNLRLSRANC